MHATRPPFSARSAWRPAVFLSAAALSRPRLRARFAVLCWAFSCLFALTAPLHLTSCGSDDRGSGRRRRGDVEEEDGGYEASKARADEALKAATKAGCAEHFPEQFKKEQARIEEAEESILDGEIDRGTKKYRLAASGLRNLVKKTEELVAYVAKVATQKEAADEAREKAVKAGAEENAPRMFSDAMGYYEGAIANLEEKTKEGAKKARGQFLQAIELFERAGEAAVENVTYKEQAKSQKQSMLKYKDMALKKQANTAALTVWQYGESAELKAETAFKRGDFMDAVRGYEEAAQQYLQALQRVLDAAELAKLEEEQRKLAEEQLEKDREFMKEMAARTGSRRGGGTPGTLPLGTGGVTGVGQVAVAADCLKEEFDPTEYPNELDDEDEAFLQEHLAELTPLGAGSYDPATGQILLDYALGRLVRKEVDTSRTPNPRKYVEWEDPMTRDVKTELLLEGGSFGLGGNTKGLVLFPVPFRYYVRITYGMGIGTITGAGDFGAVVSYDKGNYFRSNFLDLGRVRGSSPPKWKAHKDKPGSRANYWADKTRRVPWEIFFQMPDPKQADKGPTKTARLTVTYDKEGEFEDSNTISFKAPRSGGFVGFVWGTVKFRLYDLKVCGILDKPMTVQILREKLGIPKSAPEEPEKPEETPEEDPTASGDGEDKGGASGEGTGKVKPVSDF